MGRFSQALLGWYDVHGRHGLPWQQRRTPYRVWVSEIMLQQTQVATVLPYYRRFMRRFASLRALAGAAEDEVLHLWSGLGYYSRARNLHRAAQLVVERHGGRFPRHFDDVVALPGIGRSTAGAILALAANQRHAILDGNVKRVLARVHCVDGDPGTSAVLNRLWDLAEDQLPHERVGDYTQAIMDLGATVCTRTNPDCDACPVATCCGAFQTGTQGAFPGKRRRKAKPVRETRMVLIVAPDDSVLLERRASTGVWGGLWSFPELDTGDDAKGWCADRFGRVMMTERWAVHRHTFTHFHLDIAPELVRLASAPGGEIAEPGVVWYNRKEPPALGLAAPVKTLLDRVGNDRGPTRAGNRQRAPR